MTWEELRKCRALSNNSERLDTGVVGTDDAFSGGGVGCVSLVDGGSEWPAGGRELSASTVIMKEGRESGCRDPDRQLINLPLTPPTSSDESTMLHDIF